MVSRGPYWLSSIEPCFNSKITLWKSRQPYAAVGDHGYSGLAFRGASRAAPFHELFINFAGGNASEACFFSAGNASAAADAARSYACKLQAEACAEFNATDPAWCAAASYLKGAARPAFPTTAASSSVQLQLKVKGMHTCALSAVDL